MGRKRCGIETYSRIIATIAATLMLLSGLSLHAQVTRASLSGQIKDPHGLAIPGAQVTVHNTATGVATSVTSNSAGEYLFTLLSPGTYNVEVTQNGFKTEERTGIVLHVNEATSLDFQLRVGAIVEHVTVSSQSVLLNTATSEVGTQRRNWRTTSQFGG